MSKRAKSATAAEAVAKSREKTGSKTIAVTLKPDEIALLDRLAERSGGRKAALISGLRSLDDSAPTPGRAIQQLRELLDTLEREIER